MIFLDESQMGPSQAIDEHRKLANAMMSLDATTGWALIKKKLEGELASAYALMIAAKTGDESLKAVTAYTCLKSIIDAPKDAVENSLRRIKQLTEQEEEEDLPPPQHHRAGPGMTFPVGNKK